MTTLRGVLSLYNGQTQAEGYLKDFRRSGLSEVVVGVSKQLTIFYWD
ncbi:MAG: hypothetical protein H8D56_20370 [Planctomycetes bacterium]|nr:hypothetical protein [Planctomycetota bacterium]MBL7142914.1 hypothetical protein [Phycisphaerae bacterium]